LKITTDSLADAVVGQFYTQYLTASGGASAYSWSIASGNLPPGLLLGTSTCKSEPSDTPVAGVECNNLGNIFGTPTQTGTFQFTTKVVSGTQIATKNFKITVTKLPTNNPSITITSPNGGESWKTGSTQTIKWNSSNLGALNVNLDLVNEYGYFVKDIVGNISNSGQYKWTIPSSISAGNYKVLVGTNDKGPSAQDYSDKTFSIVSSGDTQNLSIAVSTDKSTYLDTEPIYITITAKNNSSLPTTLNFSDGCQTHYSVAFYDSASNVSCIQILTSVYIPAYGSYDWKSIHSPSTYKIPVGSYKLEGRVTGYGSATSPVTITSGSTSQSNISISSPNGGETWKTGSTQTIKWTSSDLGSLGVNLDLFNEQGLFYTSIIGNISNVSQYKWTIPDNIPLGNYKVLIGTNDKGPSAQDISDGFFVIQSPNINKTDFDLFKSCFGKTASGDCAKSDFDGNGSVGISDFNLLRGALLYDLNGDKVIDINYNTSDSVQSDYEIFINCFGKTASGSCVSSDFDQNGSVGISDFNLIRSALKYDLNGDSKIDLTNETNLSVVPTQNSQQTASLIASMQLIIESLLKTLNELK